LYIDFLTILFSFIVLVKLVRLSLVFVKGNLTWLNVDLTRHNWHNWLLPTPRELVTDLLRGNCMV